MSLWTVAWLGFGKNAKPLKQEAGAVVKEQLHPEAEQEPELARAVLCAEVCCVQAPAQQVCVGLLHFLGSFQYFSLSFYQLKLNQYFLAILFLYIYKLVFSIS